MSGVDSRWLMPQEVGCLYHFGIPSWLMPLRDRSGQRWPPSGTWSQRPKFVQGSLEPVASLVPPPSPSLPFLSLLFGVFLNGRLRIAPFFLWCVPGRLFVAGNTCLFLFSPLPFSPSLFLSFSLSSPPSFLLGCPWMLCHSWEPCSAPPLVCPWTHAS